MGRSRHDLSASGNLGQSGSQKPGGMGLGGTMMTGTCAIAPPATSRHIATTFITAS